MSSQDPLEQQNKSCDQLNSDWNGELNTVWKNCVDDKKEMEGNRLWKKLGKQEKQNKMNAICCQEVLQCNNKNDWLQKNNYSYRCTIKEEPNQPHFGSIAHGNNSEHNYAISQNLRHGVY